MSSPYVGEIRMFAGNFAPNGWMLCQGQLIPIADNPTLFQLIGTTYGGDGQETFALPNLSSRVPLHAGNGHVLGESGGVEEVTLTTNQIPVHNHIPQAFNNNGSDLAPLNDVWAGQTAVQQYEDPANLAGVFTQMQTDAVKPTGGSQPHDNMMPFLAINFIISLFGLFPSQT